MNTDRPKAVPLIRDAVARARGRRASSQTRRSRSVATSEVAVVAALEEIDLVTAGQLDAALLEAAGHGHTTVVVDMSLTRFCDCSGLRVLVRARNRALAENGELRLLVPVDSIVRRLLSMAGLDRSIIVFANLADAVETGRLQHPA